LREDSHFFSIRPNLAGENRPLVAQSKVFCHGGKEIGHGRSSFVLIFVVLANAVAVCSLALSSACYPASKRSVFSSLVPNRNMAFWDYAIGLIMQDGVVSVWQLVFDDVSPWSDAHG